MTRKILAVVLASLFICGATEAATFTYHGDLQDAGKAADGEYDLELTLFSSSEGGRVIGGPLIMYKVPVHNGAFSTRADFGTIATAPGETWLQVRVRSATSNEFSALTGRAPVSVDLAEASCPGSWTLGGNAGNPGTSFLGTADTQPLTIKVDNSQVANAFLSSGAQVASWIGGGAQNFSVSANGSFIGGGGSATVAGNANGVGPYGFVGGGLGNQAGVGGSAYAGVGGGINNHASGSSSFVVGGSNNLASNDYATVCGGTGNTASGLRSAVPGGTSNIASGLNSFAAGQHANAVNDGSFVWADNSSASNFATTAVNQYLVRAQGGVGINGVPKNSAIELSIYPTTAVDYSNIFLGTTGNAAGILMSAGDATAGNNDASFYLDQYDGSGQVRKMTIGSDGMAINGPKNTVDNEHPGLTLYTSPADAALSGQIIEDFVGAGGYLQIEAYAPSNGPFGEFNFSYGTSPTSSITLLNLQSDNGSSTMTVFGDALKPGGGPWLASSDRRIKQDVLPINNAVDTILKLRPVSFHYTPDYRQMEGGLSDKTYLGFVAQDFAEVFPEAVTRTSEHVPGAPASDPNILALDANPALITTVAAVQELAVQLHDRESDIAALHAENAALRSELNEIRSEVKKLHVNPAQ